MENRNSSGFTLVELILAVSIAVLLLALIFSLYHTLSRTVDDQEARRTGGAAMLYALDQLTRDLSSALPVPGHEEGGFLLETTEGARGAMSHVTFCTTRYAPGFGEERDLRWFEIVEVSYWLEYEPRERGRLLRTERPIIGPEALEPPRTNVLATGVDVFHVRVRGEEDWVDAWQTAHDDEEMEWPRAARIVLEPDDRARGARPNTVDVLIPTGWTIEPEEDRE